jgi:hypothetical protein
MIPGNLVHPTVGNLHIFDSVNPFGMFVSTFPQDQFGIVIDSCYSNTDVPYVQILTSDGIKGWVRYEKVRVVR